MDPSFSLNVLTVNLDQYSANVMVAQQVEVEPGVEIFGTVSVQVPMTIAENAVEQDLRHQAIRSAKAILRSALKSMEAHAA